MDLPKILLVEDDAVIAKTIGMNLSLSGYSFSTCETIEEARQKVGGEPFDVILLDVNLPDGSGLDFCHELRTSNVEAPILFLSARSDEETVVKAMNIGAEDYVRKPFGMEELKIRIGKAMRHAVPKRKILAAGPLTLDLNRRQAEVSGRNLILSRREFDILTTLAKKAGDVVSREAIVQYLEESADIYDRTIDSHVSHLRRKIRDVCGNGLQVVSIYGVGYRLTWTD